MDTKTARRLRCVGLIALGALPFASTPAYAKPTVRLALPAQADSGVAVPYSFTASGVPSKAKLVIQQQMGTAGRFRTVATLAHTPTGSGTLPGLSMGRHNLRIAVIEKVKRRGPKATSVLLAKHAKSLAVFADVPFVTLFSQDSEGTFALPSRSFAYVFSVNAFDTLNSVAIVGRAKNTCRSVYVNFAVADLAAGTQDLAVLSVIQESRGAVRAEAAVGAVSAVDSPLTPGEAWSILTQSKNGKTLRVYVNGIASCSSSTVQ